MEENLEVLTENGEPTGIGKPRSEVHNNGYWHRTVHIWIMNDNNELLLQKRDANKEGSPGKWDISCGGHCAYGETSMQSVFRELNEELGLSFKEDEIDHLFTARHTSRQGLNNEFADVYLIKYNYDINNLKFQKEEIEGLMSINFKELQNRYLDPEFNIARKDNEYEKLFEILNKIIKTN